MMGRKAAATCYGDASAGRRLKLDCSAGARKDSLVDALAGLLDDAAQDAFAGNLGKIGISGLGACVVRGGDGAHVAIEIDGKTEQEARSHHEHHSLDEVRSKIRALDVEDGVKLDALGIYDILADAEAKAHRTNVEGVHFHEVGNDFAIAHIVAFCMLVHALAPESIVATPIATGYGFVDCAHGRLPIPAPATANVLAGLPTIVGDVEGELTTPTGAAMVRYFAF